MGKQRAMELVLTGRRISAEEAHELGSSPVAPRDGWLDAALELAERGGGAAAARGAARASRPCSPPRRRPLSAGLDHERRLYELAMATEDRVEGMNAFLEKRRPEFRGR